MPETNGTNCTTKIVTPTAAVIAFCKKPLANGATRKIIWTIMGTICTVAAAIFFLGGRYTYISAQCDKVNSIEKSISDMKTDLAITNTNVTWIRKSMEEKGKK